MNDCRLKEFAVLQLKKRNSTLSIFKSTYNYKMRENPFPKMKIPSSKTIEKKQQPSNSLQMEELKRKLYDIDSTVKNASLDELRNFARDLRKACHEKHQEMTNSEKMFKMEAFKNQRYKSQVHEQDQKCEAIRFMLTNRLIDQYKDNKESPLFHNENGLSPFQMLLLHYSRNDIQGENICMICFMDIQPNTQIVQLPCTHILHRECAVQHLLYSKACPGCSQEITFEHSIHKFEK